MSPHPNIIFITGKNFSGRTHYLKTVTSFYEIGEQTSEGVYIGPVPADYVSGLAMSVKDEMQLHLGKLSASKVLNQIVSGLNLDYLLFSNPFTLSGGEQAMVAVINAILLQPKKIALDILLEQINDRWKIPLLEMISNGVIGEMQVYIADNRFDELRLPTSITTPPICPSSEKLEACYKFHCIDSKLFVTEFYVKGGVQISLRGLSYAYQKKTPVLQNINIDLEPGTVYHLVGTNGAGKSTLSKILAGILKLPGKKNLMANGKWVDTYSHPGSLVGYSFQNPDEQLFATTVFDEVLPASYKTNEDNQRRDILLNTFGLQDVANEHPREMPFVIRKRIALAATLAMDRPWYILDEPTIGLDNESVYQLVNILEKLLLLGKSFIFISHADILTQCLGPQPIFLNEKTLRF